MQSNRIFFARLNCIILKIVHCQMLSPAAAEWDANSGQIRRTDMAKRLRYQDVSRITRSANFEQWM